MGDGVVGWYLGFSVAQGLALLMVFHVTILFDDLEDVLSNCSLAF